MDTALLQSVVTAVLAFGAAGALPRMPWQLGLRQREQRQVQAIFGGHHLDFAVCFGAAPIDERTSWRIGVDS